VSALRHARVLLLATPLTAAAADVHVSAGGTVSSDSSVNAPRDTQVVQVSGRLESAGGWGVGLEGLLRRDNDPARQSFMGLSARHQVDRMQQAYPDYSYNLNSSGLNNIVYNPYAFPPRSYKTHLNSLAVNIGYRF
jgi:hypothetical protein